MDTIVIVVLVLSIFFLLILLKFVCKKCSASERNFAYISSSNQNLVESPPRSPPTVRFEKRSVYLPTIMPYPQMPLSVNTGANQPTVTGVEQYPNPFCNSPPPPPGLGFTVTNENQAVAYPRNTPSYPSIGAGNSPETISSTEQYPRTLSGLPPAPSLGFAINNVNQATSYPLSISPFIEFGRSRDEPQAQTPQSPVPLKSVCPYPTTITTVETKYRTPSGSNPGFIKISSSMSTSSNVPRRMDTMSETAGASAPSADLISRPPYSGDGAHSSLSRPPPPSYDEAMRESQSPTTEEFSDLNTSR